MSEPLAATTFNEERLLLSTYAFSYFESAAEAPSLPINVCRRSLLLVTFLRSTSWLRLMTVLAPGCRAKYCDCSQPLASAVRVDVSGCATELQAFRSKAAVYFLIYTHHPANDLDTQA